MGSSAPYAPKHVLTTRFLRFFVCRDGDVDLPSESYTYNLDGPSEDDRFKHELAIDASKRGKRRPLSMPRVHDMLTVSHSRSVLQGTSPASSTTLAPRRTSSP